MVNSEQSAEQSHSVTTSDDDSSVVPASSTTTSIDSRGEYLELVKCLCNKGSSVLVTNESRAAWLTATGRSYGWGVTWLFRIHRRVKRQVKLLVKVKREDYGTTSAVHCYLFLQSFNFIVVLTL